VHTLLQLVESSEIEKVYCLVRGPEPMRRIQNSLRERNLELPEASKVVALTEDLSRSDLGLDSSILEEMRSQVSLIIHIAWPVNFNIPLSAFQPSLHGLLTIINFAASSVLYPHIHYISSVSSVISSTSSLVPEQILPSTTTPLPNAYAESKHISELLLSYAARKLHLSTSVARVGQVAGAADAPGLWNPSEWFPSLVISSLHLGVIPDNLGVMNRVDWVPVDRLADILVEISLSASLNNFGNLNGVPNDSAVFHPIHPYPTTWSAVRPTLLVALNELTGKDVQVITAHKWTESVKKHMESESAGEDETVSNEGGLRRKLKQNPAAKLLDFYDSVMGSGQGENEGFRMILNIEKTLEQSERLRKLEKMQDKWIKKWITEWVENLKSG